MRAYIVTGRDFFNIAYPLIHITSLIFRIFPTFLASLIWSIFSPFSGNFAVVIRYCLLARRAEKFGSNIYCGTNVIIKNPSKMSIGDNVSIHDFCYLDALGGLLIGDNVSIAHSSSILTFNHTYADTSVPIKYNAIALSKVVIENDVWVGCGVRILPGVRIGSRSIVAAGAVVTRNVPAGTLVAGVPARVIKDISK